MHGGREAGVVRKAIFDRRCDKAAFCHVDGKRPELSLVAILPIQDKNEQSTTESHPRMTHKMQTDGTLRTEAKSVSKISAFEQEEDVEDDEPDTTS